MAARTSYQSAHADAPQLRQGRRQSEGGELSAGAERLVEPFSPRWLSEMDRFYECRASSKRARVRRDTRPLNNPTLSGGECVTTATISQHGSGRPSIRTPGTPKRMPLRFLVEEGQRVVVSGIVIAVLTLMVTATSVYLFVREGKRNKLEITHHVSNVVTPNGRHEGLR